MLIGIIKGSLPISRVSPRGSRWGISFNNIKMHLMLRRSRHKRAILKFMSKGGVPKQKGWI